MEQQSVAITQKKLMRAEKPTDLYPRPYDRPNGFSGGFVPHIIRVNAGYIFKVREEEQYCYNVELHCGKVGFVGKDGLVPLADSKYKDPYPCGSQVIRTKVQSASSIFAVDSTYVKGIPVFDEPQDKGAKSIFVLGPSEAVLITAELDFYYRILLPGPTEGFVHRNYGVRRDWTCEIGSNYGFYGIKREEGKSVPIRYSPDITSEFMTELTAFLRLPVVEEWDNWFRIQLSDGTLGFVPEGSGTRAISDKTLIEANQGSGNVLTGLLTVAGLLTLGTIAGAIKQSAND